MRQITIVSMDLIKEPAVPARLNIDRQQLQELANSMRKIGLLQPVLLRKHGESYEVEAGHRRWLAAKSLNWETIEAIILLPGDMTEAHIERAHENLIRENLNPVEEAEQVRILVYEQNRGIESTADIVGKSISWVEKRMDILGFPEEILRELQDESINIAQASELSRCRDSLLRETLLETVLSTGASAQTIKTWVHNPAVEEQIKMNQAMSESLATTPIQGQGLTLTCHLCQVPTELAKMKHVWLCPGCMVDTSNLRMIIQEDKAKAEKEDEEKHDHK